MRRIAIAGDLAPSGVAPAEETGAPSGTPPQLSESRRFVMTSAMSICRDAKARAAEIEAATNRLGRVKTGLNHVRTGSLAQRAFLAMTSAMSVPLSQFAEVLCKGPDVPLDISTEMDRRLHSIAGVRVGAPPSARAFDAPVEVRPVGQHGVGVFATRDIKAGEVVTHYSGHIADCLEIGFADYGIGINGTSRFVVVGNPDDARPWQCGQLINDASAIFPNVDDALPFLRRNALLSIMRMEAGPVDMAMLYDVTLECIARCALYEAETAIAANCNFINAWDSEAGAPVGTTQARVDIARGQELTMTYGSGYWVSRSLAAVHNHIFLPHAMPLQATVFRAIEFEKAPELESLGLRKRVFPRQAVSHFLPVFIRGCASGDSFDKMASTWPHLADAVEGMIGRCAKLNGRAIVTLADMMPPGWTG